VQVLRKPYPRYLDVILILNFTDTPEEASGFTLFLGLSCVEID